MPLTDESEKNVHIPIVMLNVAADKVTMDGERHERT